MKTNTPLLRIGSGTLALFIALSPVVGFAKEDDNRGKKDSAQAKVELIQVKKDEKKEDRDEKREEKREDKREDKKDDSKKSGSCARAFGHLIAPGFIKKNGTTSLGVDCWLPFGIGKKFQGGTTNNPASTTPSSDTTAPVITSITSSPLQKEGTIKWTTNEKSNSVVFYSTTSSAVDTQSSTTPRVNKSALVKDHSVKITGLATSTVYYYKVGSRDSAGNMSFSNAMSFTTKAPNTVVTYPVVSNVATLVSSTSVAVAWKTNEQSTSKVYYGTTTPDVNVSTTSFVVNNTLVSDHAILVSGLATSTPYVFVIESKNASGNATYSNSFTATTNSGL